MNPLSVQKLLSDSPETKELVAFLRTEVAKLDTLTGLPQSRAEREVAVDGRLQAKETLETILAPFLNTSEQSTGPSQDEYVV